MRVTLNGEATVLTDILVGDVYLAGGQSNMQFRVEESTDIFPEDCEGVRYFTEPHDGNAYNEGRPCYNNLGWRHCTRENAAKFSAIGYFFAREMPKVRVCRPEGTYFLWLDFRDYGLTDEEVHNRIYRIANVFLQDGTVHDPEAGQCFQRMCVPCARSVLQEACRRIANAFAE